MRATSLQMGRRLSTAVLAALALVCVCVGACSTSGPASARGVGGTASAGGNIGEIPTGGGPGTPGGSLGSSFGGSVNAGGQTGPESRGGYLATGASAAGGAPGGGGTPGSGGTPAAAGATASGGALSMGGIGLATGTGGATTLTGGSVSSGGATGDRCDVGIYDSAHPPQALTLAGNLGAHDPSSIESNGTYFEFQTGLGAKTSTNLTTWSVAGAPFGTPAWMAAAVPGVADLWAPDISYFGGMYHLYYAGSTFGTNKSCIGHAKRASLASDAWADQGSATLCSNVTSTGDNWNAIDPNVIIDASGTPWLTFGSFWGGIKIVQLDQNGARVGTTVTGIAARPDNGGAIEGPFMARRCGYYYLFTSWDTCCKGASSTYNIRVVRGTAVTGPFADKAGTAAMQGGGTLIAKTGGDWAGPGGQSVMFVGANAYLVYHAYAMSNGIATLRIANLVWDASGWPVAVGP